MMMIQTYLKAAAFLLCFSMAFSASNISTYDPDDLLGNPIDDLLNNGPPHHNSSSEVHTATPLLPHVCPEFHYQNMTLKGIWDLHYDTLRVYVISFLYGTLCLYWIIAIITIVSMFCCCYPRGLKEADAAPEVPVSSKPSGVAPGSSMKSQKSIKASKKEGGEGMSKKSSKKSMKSTKKSMKSAKKNKKTTSIE